MFEEFKTITPYGNEDYVFKGNDINEYTMGDILKIDNDYTFSVWMRSDNNITTEVHISEECGIFELNSEWKKVIFTAKSNIKTSREVYFTIPEGSTIYAYQAQLEIGTIASDFHVSEEDVEDGIETLKKQMSLEIDSEVARIVKRTEKTLAGKEDKEAIEKWASFDGDNLELGASDSDFKSIITREELAFKQGSNVTSWFANNEMYVKRMMCKDYFQIGHLALEHIERVGYVFRKAAEIEWRH